MNKLRAKLLRSAAKVRRLGGVAFALVAVAVLGPSASAQIDYAAEVTAMTPAISTKDLMTEVGGKLIDFWLPVAIFGVIFGFVLAMTRKMQRAPSGKTV